ncbi:MAG: hypothetical protein JST93_18125 [Acidobacteria bacterium]|nr:hypothetical protein [Acidobacteriota bacterium]
MKKLLFGTLFLGTAMMAADMTGWISDASCGSSNANASKASRDCAQTCIKSGSKAVFVADEGGKVYQLSDPAKAAKFLDKKVKVSGKVAGDKIEMASIAYVQ